MGAPLVCEMKVGKSAMVCLWKCPIHICVYIYEVFFHTGVKKIIGVKKNYRCEKKPGAGIQQKSRISQQNHTDSHDFTCKTRSKIFLGEKLINCTNPETCFFHTGVKKNASYERVSSARAENSMELIN